MTGWRIILGALIGAIGGVLITAGMFLYTSTSARQETTAREFLWLLPVEIRAVLDDLHVLPPEAGGAAGYKGSS
jgi:hypothetical protein